MRDVPSRPRRVAACAAVLVVVAGLVPAQAEGQTPPQPPPTPAPQPQPQPEPSPPPQPQPPATPPQDPVPIDPARAAAELLRRRLGLSPGPGGAPPPGPAQPQAGEQGRPQGQPQGQPQGPPQAPPQDPPPQPPAPQAQEPLPDDPARAAAELLRRRLGLSPGPGGPPPPGPPQPQPEVPGPPQDPTTSADEALRRLLGARDPAATGAPPVVPSPDAVPIDGSLGLRYRARHGAGVTDQDVVARLDANLGDAARHAVTAHVRTRAFWNVDGTRADDSFAGLDQSFGDQFDARLYAAHVDVHRGLPLALFRAGRQDLDETPTSVTFDGVRADTPRWGGALQAWVSAYGGVPVHQFEASDHGDSVVGLSAGFAPWQGGRVRVDAMDLRDDYLAVDRRDRLLGARWWQSVGDVLLHGLYTVRDGDPRDLVVGASGLLPGGLDFGITFRELLSTQRQQVTELDPFWDVGFDYAPYRQLETSLQTDVAAGVSLGIAADVRALKDDADERAFNREFEHWRAFAVVDDLFVRGLSLSVSGSLWESTGEDSRAVSGELVWRPDRDLRLLLGSGYDLFRYDAFDDRERLHVRSWYLRVERRLLSALRVDGAYEVERDDLDEFHLFRLGLTWTF